jgi:hypothetical protein
MRRLIVLGLWLWACGGDASLTGGIWHRVDAPVAYVFGNTGIYGRDEVVTMDVGAWRVEGDTLVLTSRCGRPEMTVSYELHGDTLRLGDVRFWRDRPPRGDYPAIDECRP